MQGDPGRLAERLAYDRKRRRLTQRETAERLGVSRRAVELWEVGAVIPNVGSLKLYAGELGSDLALLVALRADAIRNRRPAAA